MREIERHLEYQVEKQAENIKNRAEYIIRNMTHLIDNIDNKRYESINSLGEIQGAGLELDRDIALLKNAIKIGNLLADYSKKGEIK